jgi:large subunit ribosomal protein L24e
MVVKRQCSFCAAEIEPGTGAMFVKRDGTVFHFCSSSCRKQQLHLGRVGHRFKWTRAHALRVASDRSSSERAASAARSAGAGTKHRAPRRPPSAAPAPAGETTAAPAPPPVTAETAPVASAPPAETPAPAEEKPKPRTRARKKPAPPAGTS